MAKLNGLTKVLNKGKVFFKKNSPFILVTAGVGLMATGAVVACKETMKVEEIVDTHLEYKEKIETLVADKTEIPQEDGTVIVCDEAYGKKTKRSLTIRTIFKLVKNYAPAALLIIAGALCVFKGVNILNNRLADTSAALAASTSAFSKYREYIRGTENGEQLDRDAITGKTVIDEINEVVDENGNITAEVKEKTLFNPNSDTAFIVDEKSSIWRNSPQHMLTDLRNIIESANFKVLCTGYIFECDILDKMQEPRFPAAQNRGWMSSRWNKDFPYGEGEDAYVHCYINGVDITRNDFPVEMLTKPFCIDFNCAPEPITPYL